MTCLRPCVLWSLGGANAPRTNVYDIQAGITVNMSKLICIGILQFALRI